MKKIMYGVFIGAQIPIIVIAVTVLGVFYLIDGVAYYRSQRADK